MDLAAPKLYRRFTSCGLGCMLVALACGGSESPAPPSETGGVRNTNNAKGGANGADASTSSVFPTGGSGGVAATSSSSSSGAPASEAGAHAEATQGAGGDAGRSAGAEEGGAKTGNGGMARPGAGGGAADGGIPGRAQGGRLNRGSEGGVPAEGGQPAAGYDGSNGVGGTAAVDANSTQAAPSNGCGATSTPKSGRFTVDVSGTTREYILKVPDGYDAQHPYRLIFGWHGRQYDAEWVANGEAPLTGPYFGLEAEAKGTAVFVAPQALSSGWSNEGGRDLAFVDAMLSKLEGTLCIDTNRVFSTGFSFGALLTITIGCNNGGEFRAIAPMSGSIQNTCPNGTPVAFWASHGDADPTIPISNGEAARDEFVERNHCEKQTKATDRQGCVTFEGCDPGYPVEWCVFSGKHEPAPFAGEAIWKFLSQF